MHGSQEIFEETIAEHLAVIEALRRERDTFQRVASKTSEAILKGNKVLWCGNGGSAADSQQACHVGGIAPLQVLTNMRDRS